MELNLKYYKGTDEYSDGDIEDKIIDFIKKYPDDYEKAFEEDCSWPVFYHLSSVRKNVISWYPFKKNASILEVGAGMGAITSELVRKCKKVTSIELSKRRATAILERNINAKNLEIIVGNFNDIELKEKYDYILLNGVLEYAALYMNSSNPYVDFINKLKTNLKPDGKILIAIENRFGLKYWCGANEDHIGKMFEGIKGYPNSKSIKTFGKYELEVIAKKCDMNVNFYYMFPDYKFPKVIFTDESLDKGIFSDYIPYYSSQMNILLSEHDIYNSVYENRMVPFFANSYFLELSENENLKEIEFVKFNNEFRKNIYDVYTYFSGEFFYKKSNNESSKLHLNNIYNIYKKSESNNILEVQKKCDCICSKVVNGISLIDYLKKLYNVGDIKHIYIVFDDIYELIKKNCKITNATINNNIFVKYNVTLDEKDFNKMTFCFNGLLDIIPSNIIYSDGKYILIDQEWFEKMVPLEYIMYRAINNFFNNLDDKLDLKMKLFEKYCINDSLFSKLDIEFLNEIKADSFKYYYNYFLNHKVVMNPNDYLVDITLYEQNSNLKKLMEKIEYENSELKKVSTIVNNENFELKDLMYNLETKNVELTEKINDYKKITSSYVDMSADMDKVKNELQTIYSSKSWKMIEKIRKIKNKIFFFKKDEKKR